MLKDFKAFIMKGNVIDMAVGIIIGVAFAFGAIVSSLVKDVIMPPIGLALGKIDFSNLAVVLKQGTTPAPYDSLAAAQAAGAVTLNYGLFINTIRDYALDTDLILCYTYYCEDEFESVLPSFSWAISFSFSKTFLGKIFLANSSVVISLAVFFFLGIGGLQ